MSTTGNNQPARQGARRSLASLFSQVGSASTSSSRRPTTTNLDNPINPAPRVRGQETYNRTSTGPRDRGLGFSTFNRPTSGPTAPSVPSWIRERDRRMAEDPSAFPKGFPFARKRKGRVDESESESGSESESESDDDGDNESDDDNVGDDVGPSSSQGKPRRKATHYGAPPLPSASKKRKRNKAASPEEEKFTDRAFPEAPDQADEADQMLYKMGGRLERNWDEIEKKWEEMTGEAPGTGTNVNLTARFLWTIKLYAYNGVLDLPDEIILSYPPYFHELIDINKIAKQDKLIARLKEEVEKEREVSLWREIARRYQAATQDGLSAATLRRYWYEAQDKDVPLEKRAPAQAGEDDEETDQSGLVDIDPKELEEARRKVAEAVQAQEKGPLVSYESDSD